MKDLLIIISFLLSFNGIMSQETILCPLLKENIKIESTDDIPTITNNTDGTISLIHQDQNITNIFATYVIYDFYQSFPSANPNGELIKYYTIVHKNKALINELYDYVSSDIYQIYPYTYTSISSDLISFLDNKTFRLIKYCTDSTEGGLPCPEGEQSVPSDFELKIAFQYDSINDMMLIETVGTSSCGNSFSIALKGELNDGIGTTDNRLQLWISSPGISTTTDYNEPCHDIENMLYSILDIGCQDGHNYGNIRFNIDTENSGEFILERENALFATDLLTFRDDELSIEDNTFQSIYPYITNNNPYLQITNPDNQNISVEIFNSLGQSIAYTKRFENNSVNLSRFNSGLYFIKLSDSNNQQKIHKLILN